MSPLAIGFIYVISNQSMPGLVKVGRSSRLPEDRAKELHTTGVPHGFDVDHRAITSRPIEVERRAHELLAPFRVASNREFFRTTPKVAIGAVRRAALEVAGSDAWTHKPIHHLRSGDRVALTLRARQIFVLIVYPGSMQLLAGSAQIRDVWQAHSDGDVLEIFATDDPRYVAGLSDNDPQAESDPVPFLDRAGSAANGRINGRERLVPGDRLLWLDSHPRKPDCTSVLFEASSYCQVVGRTWSPKLRPDGAPLLMNVLTMHRPPTAMISAIQEALALPMPREWAPRYPDDSDGWPTAGTNPPSSAYWLPQLDPTRKRGKGTRREKRRPGTTTWE
jgi:T5orf172 domain